MHLPIADRVTADAATALITSHGARAGGEAALRADQSRDRGNVVLYCRWRQVERLVVLLSTATVHGTVH